MEDKLPLYPPPFATTDWSFVVDKVLHSSSQEDVYDTCARDIVSKALDGFKWVQVQEGSRGGGVEGCLA